MRKCKSKRICYKTENLTYAKKNKNCTNKYNHMSTLPKKI